MCFGDLFCSYVWWMCQWVNSGMRVGWIVCVHGWLVFLGLCSVCVWCV